MTVLRTTLCIGFLLFSGGSSLHAKEWRGIVPLKSTRADVERILGKENELGRYQFEDERAYVSYSQAPCDNRAGKCACAIRPGTVVSIYVTLEVSRKFSELKIDNTKYQRRPLKPGSSGFSYSNFSEGLIYHVDESRDQIIGIEYLQSASDCEALLRAKGSQRPGVAHQLPQQPSLLTSSRTLQQKRLLSTLRPLYSTRSDVELLLGPGEIINGSHFYKSGSDNIEVRYVEAPCGSPGSWWNVPIDTVAEIEVIPMKHVTLKDLDLDLSKFQRVEGVHPENIFHYMNAYDGVFIQTRWLGDGEKVLFIKYGATISDKRLRCKVD